MSNNLKAILLSAGYGTRLRPLTLEKPKCLIKINKKPILEIWLDKLSRLGCKEVLINTHYLSEQVDEFIHNYKSKYMKIITTHEDTLLGTAGTLLKNINFVEDETLMIHSDNFTTSNLNGLIKKHRAKSKNCLLTMLTFKTSDPKNCGIVEVDSKGIVKSFHEKVSCPPGNIANGAVYIFDENFLDWLMMQKRQLFDFSNDVLPYLAGKIQTWHTKDFFIDIGTPESLKKARTISKTYQDKEID